jgi:uncharacterized protein YceK
MKWLVFAVMALFLSSCGTISIEDKATLNHPMMDLSKRNTPDSSGQICSLGGDSASKGQGCTTCAH